MKAFIDANVLIAVINKEYPAFDSCSRFLSLAENNRFQIYVSTLSLGICWYFAEKKNGRKVANEKIRLVMDYLFISESGDKEAKSALKEIRASDFEDALQVESAKSASCSCIVTLNQKDFYFSGLEVLSPFDFLMKYA